MVVLVEPPKVMAFPLGFSLKPTPQEEPNLTASHWPTAIAQPMLLPPWGVARGFCRRIVDGGTWPGELLVLCFFGLLVDTVERHF